MYQVITTPLGKQYADTQREAERFGDPYAEILWMIDGYEFFIAEPSLQEAYYAYAREFDLMSVNAGIEGLEPQDLETFSKVVDNGFVTWVLTHPNPGAN